LALAQPAKFGLKLSKGNFAAALADEGFTADRNVVNAQRTLTIMFLFDKVVYQETRVLYYNSTPRLTGYAK
jgi:hypothetical protein